MGMRGGLQPRTPIHPRAGEQLTAFQEASERRSDQG